MTSEVKPELSIEELRRRFENGEISSDQFGYETAVRATFSDVWFGKDRVIVTLWRDLDDNLVLPEDAPTKAAVGDAVMYAATEDHHQIGTATLMGPFFHEYARCMAHREVSHQESTDKMETVADDARYILERTVGEARYDTNEQLHVAWERHMIQQGLKQLSPGELRSRFIDAYAAWKTNRLDTINSGDVAFFQTSAPAFQL